MRIFWAISIAAVYGLGLITIKWLDSVLPEKLRESPSHLPVLILMWLFTPVMIVAFILKMIWGWITKHFKITL